MLPLEREGRAFRVVLVVGTRFARRRGDPGELPVQGRGPGAGPRTLRQQQFAGSRHLPDFRYAADESAGRAASIPEAGAAPSAADGHDARLHPGGRAGPGPEWQCPGCTGFTAQFTRLDFLDNYDARFVIVTQGPIDEALAYKRRVGNKMTWYSTENSPFGSDVGAPPGGGFAVNVFLRDGDTVYRTWHTNGRGTEQLTHTFALRP